MEMLSTDRQVEALKALSNAPHHVNSRSEAGPWSETDVAQVSPVQLNLTISQAA